MSAPYVARATQPQLQSHHQPRRPFANNANINATSPQPKAAAIPDKVNKYANAAPPLPRQNSKTTPPSPPRVITDKNRLVEFNRIGFLGEGGFARVYEVKDARGSRYACKVVTKTSLKTKKAKTKLYAEIKIHRSLSHPNIVRFADCFEDEDNVYMTLELCSSGSLMDMLRRRRRFTEPEARFFIVQLIGACNYMHTHQVIHRDLKLGNLFLDASMNIKVGDFGLAALIENEGERKKTICGTPNYIAPEVLFDQANGHSFEVDTWSIGVILYTLIIGRPPFQTKEVKDIYTRIRDNEYEFPSEKYISGEAKSIITRILTPDPSQRPTLLEIIASPFIEQGIIPGFIPMSALDTAPDFRYITRQMSAVNLARLKKSVLLDGEPTSIALPSAQSQSSEATSVSVAELSDVNARARSHTTSLAQQEKEFQKAVQPGSPISALLSSARQPLVMANTDGRSVTNPGKESPLFRKLQAAQRRDTKSPLRNVRNAAGLGDIEEEEQARQPGAREKDYEMQRAKELQSQKARIVAQMAPHVQQQYDDLENMPPGAFPSSTSLKRDGKGKERERAPFDAAVARPTAAPSAPQPESQKLSGFDAAAHTLTQAFDAKAAGRLFRNPALDAALPDERVFIVSWVDYCNKYGMGYALTDGAVGVHFNDSTTLVLSADKQHFDYVSSRRHGSLYVRKNFTVSEYPEDLKNKVYLLKHFERYIMDRLYGEYNYTFEDTERTRGMDFVQKYLRMKHVIVFKLSHDVLQFNFYDHSKLILSSAGHCITHIDKNYQMTRWTLAQVMAASLAPPSEDADEAKFMQRLVDKLKYCKEVLVSIRNASAGTTTGLDEGAEMRSAKSGAALR
ncbi:Pkinase-domain-containing protein [Coniophora puteana RWD-64-598 SS2]|uniref:Serine/threonine-protein kinase n=1 Tax=Coniophora puteana (strain RWD-64-598) TaxID=741705 RepID=A0A5M3MG64_CONPW|nr:Pkinase-domain-containing protein [Coniophora puteana RWD-64-598 SS2]EIW78238.1 Pkinase-domain-containing protein [Coniophora puteana RWD-64-598 SS2]